MPAVRVLIADDHRAFGQGLRALLATLPERVEVIGVADDGARAVSMANQLQPDVVLMDLNMPIRNGIDATRAITEANPHIRVLMLTMFDNDESVLAALRAGARGYVLKGTGRDDLLRAIDNVCKGELILGSALASNFIRGLNPTSHAPASAFPELSAREAEILELIASGATNSEISASLFLSPNTVRNHITNIFAKLGVTHRAQAVVLAQRRQHDQRP